MAEARPSETLSRTSFGILFCVSIVVAIGNTGLQSVLPSMSRELGFKDWMAPAIFSLSAVLWAIMSPIWARQSDLRGRKPLIMLGLIGFLISMVLCGLVISAGLHHVFGYLAVFILFLFARATFGLIGSASNPATQAYLAERTSRETRTEQMAGLASAFGLGTVVGPVLASILVVPVLSFAGPLFAFALIAGGMLVVVFKYLPEKPVPMVKDARPFSQAGVGGFIRNLGKLLGDPRLAPFLIFGFLVSACQTAQGQILGFMIIDKLHVPASETQRYTAMAMMAGAMAGLLAQWGLIRIFRMSPAALMRWGVGLAAIANLMTAFAHDYLTVVLGFALGSLGYSFARPGFTAGASLTVGMGEQAQTAGAIAMVNGLNVVLGPLFVAIYGFNSAAPFLINALVLAALTFYAMRNPMLRTAGEKATADAITSPSDDLVGDTAEEKVTLALLEKSDEGGA